MTGPALNTTSLVKDYGDIRAVNSLDLLVRTGEIYGFLGPNGAGKTTTIRLLTGTSRPTSGKAEVNGVDVHKEPVKAKSYIGVVSQHINVDADLTVRESLVLHGILHGMKKDKREQRIAELLEFSDLSDRAQKLTKTLSGGMKRKLTIIRSLLHGPRILFLDEPTTGLDAGARRKMWELVRAINRDGVTIFLTTHYIEEAEALCHRVGIVEKGKIIGEGTPKELIESIGIFAVDEPGEKLSTSYFKTKDEAFDYIRNSSPGAVLRSTNLEDFFLAKTGHKVL